MKKILLITALFCISLSSNSIAQCTPDPTVVAAGNSGIFPTPAEGIANGKIDSAYEQVFTIVVPTDTMVNPADFVPGAPSTPISVPINSITVNSVTVLPIGLANTCAISCVYAGGTNGCFVIDGTPTESGTFTVNVNVTMNVDAPAVPPLFPGGPTDAPAADITYTLTIADTGNGACAVTVTMSQVHETTVGADDGTATVTAAGGTAPYTYLWSDTQTTSTATGLAPGSYTVGITDAAMCTASGSATILSASTSIAAFSKGSFEVYAVMPNPSKGDAEIRFSVPSYRDVSFSVHNMIGSVVLSKKIYAEKGLNIVSLDNDLKPGVYFVTLNDGTSSATKRMVVTSK